jgi:hypothetical protein
MMKSRRMRWAGHEARTRANRNADSILVGKPERKTLGRHRYRWEGKIKMDFGETGWVGVDWIDVSQDREQWKGLVNTVINLGVL